MKEIFEQLRKDHDIQRGLLDHLIETSGDSDIRRRVFDELKSALQGHAKYEERWFYSPLMEDDMMMDKARHSVHEHHEIDEKIEELENTDFSSTAWLTKAKQLQDLVTHHLDEEEHEVFQLAGKSLSATQKKNLSKSYANDMSEYRNIESVALD